MVRRFGKILDGLPLEAAEQLMAGVTGREEELLAVQREVVETFQELLEERGTVGEVG